MKLAKRGQYRPQGRSFGVAHAKRQNTPARVQRNEPFRVFAFVTDASETRDVFSRCALIAWVSRQYLRYN